MGLIKMAQRIRQTRTNRRAETIARQRIEKYQLTAHQTRKALEKLSVLLEENPSPATSVRSVIRIARRYREKNKQKNKPEHKTTAIAIDHPHAPKNGNGAKQKIKTRGKPGHLWIRKQRSSPQPAKIPPSLTAQVKLAEQPYVEPAQIISLRKILRQKPDEATEMRIQAAQHIILAELARQGLDWRVRTGTLQRIVLPRHPTIYKAAYNRLKSNGILYELNRGREDTVHLNPHHRALLEKYATVKKRTL